MPLSPLPGQVMLFFLCGRKSPRNHKIPEIWRFERLWKTTQRHQPFQPWNKRSHFTCWNCMTAPFCLFGIFIIPRSSRDDHWLLQIRGFLSHVYLGWGWLASKVEVKTMVSPIRMKQFKSCSTEVVFDISILRTSQDFQPMLSFWSLSITTFAGASCPGDGLSLRRKKCQETNRFPWFERLFGKPQSNQPFQQWNKRSRFTCWNCMIAMANAQDCHGQCTNHWQQFSVCCKLLTTLFLKF